MNYRGGIRLQMESPRLLTEAGGRLLFEDESAILVEGSEEDFAVFRLENGAALLLEGVDPVAVIPDGPRLQLESGDLFLLESGDGLLLEGVGR